MMAITKHDVNKRIEIQIKNKQLHDMYFVLNFFSLSVSYISCFMFHLKIIERFLKFAMFTVFIVARPALSLHMKHAYMSYVNSVCVCMCACACARVCL